ncbi:MAG TPA: PEP-CTERM sorting domain-containing protein [Longimicrobiales bacterium]|nr:PEP-CTERM sorting domain-containing protein [Longimicrobiales bacterium]
MRKIMMFAGITAVLGAATPASAQWAQFHEWDFCTANALSVCMNFTLNRETGTDNYTLRVTYVSTDAAAGQQGAMTAAGLYTANNAAELNIQNLGFVAISPSTASWGLGGTGLTGGGPINVVVGANADQGITNGLPVAGWVELSFTSSNLGTYNMNDLHARSHVQGFGPNNCSLKPDSNLPGTLVDPASEIDERCGAGPPTEVVPEPITMILLGSGLLGVGGAQARRRRRNALTEEI